MSAFVFMALEYRVYAYAREHATAPADRRAQVMKDHRVGHRAERTLASVGEFAVFILFGVIVAGVALLALGRWYPGSGAEQLDWRPARSPEVEAELEREDIDQMLEARNARRRATGRRQLTEDDVRARLEEDERWREVLRRRAGSPPTP